MARPWKHPKTGVYYVRKRVPADLRSAVGAEVVKITLGTKNPVEAKSRFLKALDKLEERWANMRRGEQKLSERDAHALANRTFDSWILAHRDDPSTQFFWRTKLYDTLWTAQSIDPTIENIKKFGAAEMRDNFSILEMRRFCAKFAERCITTNGLSVDAISRAKLERAFGAAFQRGSVALERMAEGYDQDKHLTAAILAVRSGLTSAPDRDVTPILGGDTQPGNTNLAKFSMSALLAAWWLEAKAGGRKSSTYESYRNTATYFVRFLGHDDATRVKAEDIIAFKDHRLTTPSPKTGRVASAKTVKDSDLSALKTLFGWAVANRKITKNPALGVTIKIGKARRLRNKSFTHTEAIAILAAARDYENLREQPGTVAAKRWVPWLCAFTGARVGEIAQLRRQDVRREGDRWVIRITPEAGTVKTNEAREIVLHAQLVDQGFPAFVEKCAAGPLFLRPSDDGDVLGPLRGLKNRLTEFARRIVSDPNVAPNHGWRHRFKTVGMEAGIAPRILDAIQGQAAQTVADTYGEVTLKTIATAIDKLPSYELAR